MHSHVQKRAHLLPRADGILDNEPGRLEETVEQLLLRSCAPPVERSHYMIVARVSLVSDDKAAGSKSVVPLSKRNGKTGHSEHVTVVSTTSEVTLRVNQVHLPFAHDLSIQGTYPLCP